MVVNSQLMIDGKLAATSDKDTWRHEHDEQNTQETTAQSFWWLLLRTIHSYDAGCLIGYGGVKYDTFQPASTYSFNFLFSPICPKIDAPLSTWQRELPLSAITNRLTTSSL